MNHWERHEQMLRVAALKGTISLRRAMEITGASAATIRRDFAEMASAGAVERIRGGVRGVRREGNLPFAMRQAQHSDAKNAIAREAADLLRHGDVVFVDGGTTTFHLCLHLPAVPLRIITNSLRIAAYLADANTADNAWEVYLTGGLIHAEFGLLAGPGTLHSLDFYHADWAFLSVGGIGVAGLYNTSETVVETERKMIAQSDRAVVLADHSKLGQRAMCRIGGLGRIDRLITDDAPQGRDQVRVLQKEGLKVVAV
ncbi:MAG: DeoR/GlpR family DNA-binding transcription regulator [Algisphaera sp.]